MALTIIIAYMNLLTPLIIKKLFIKKVETIKKLTIL